MIFFDATRRHSRLLTMDVSRVHRFRERERDWVRENEVKRERLERRRRKGEERKKEKRRGEWNEERAQR